MAFPFAALPFVFELVLLRSFRARMSWNRSWSRNNSWSSSSWQDESGSNPSWNNWGRQQTSTQPSVPENPVAIPQSFKPDSECYDTNTVSGKKFYRNVQTTPWSSKAGLAGKDVNSIRLVDITRKGLDDYSLRNLSNGEFQGVVFVRSVSEAVFTTNLLRLLRQDKVDLDKVAAHLHGAAPPDKHKESSRFTEPLLSELLQTFKKISPPESPPEDNEELARAKRKLKAAGIELSPPVKRRTSELSEPSSSARKSEHPLPVEQSPAEVILNKAVEQKPASYPSANTKAAMDTWLKSHQSQFRGQTLKFKKHVAQVTEIISSSGLAKSEIIDSAVRYGLNPRLASRLSVTNLATFIAACQYEAS